MNIFLIDADNLNSGAWVDEAFRVLEETEGRFPVRRAYGSAENLKALADTLRAWAVRPFVNLALSKNTTDMALAVDAMELACQNPAPALIVIGSGDADFTPLVVRLRERGIRVVCVSERSKMGREAIPAYDRVILVGEEVNARDAAGPAPARKTTRRAAAKKTASPAQSLPEPAPQAAMAAQASQASQAPQASQSPARKAAAKTPVRQKTPRQPKPVPAAAVPGATKDQAGSAPRQSGALAASVPAAAAPPVELQAATSPEPNASQMPTLDLAAILAAAPALQSGQPQSLAAVAKALLDAKLRGKNMTATKLLKKFASQFVLAPPEKPRTVQYLAVAPLP